MTEQRTSKEQLHKHAMNVLESANWLHECGYRTRGQQLEAAAKALNDAARAAHEPEPAQAWSCACGRTSQPPSDELERYRSYEHIEAQHGEIGRIWSGPRYKMPVGFHEISNESGVTDEEWEQRRPALTKLAALPPTE